MAGESMSEAAEDATRMIKAGDTTAKGQSPLVHGRSWEETPGFPARWSVIPILSPSSALDSAQHGLRRVALAQLGVC